VISALRDAGLPGSALILQITETVLVSSSADADDVLELLTSLRAEGVRVAVDDFGTGVELGNSLRLSSIAEAVETPEQAERLRQLDCPQAQGYHFSRPLPAADLDAVLTSTDGVLHGTPVLS
jgi:EAL domain-containing protein (putative c-di-GMP-specific phosphodiesterase class I)